MTYADLLHQALLLPEADRVSFAHDLLQSTQAELESPSLSDAWVEEIERRLNELDQGRVQLLDYDEVMKEAEQAQQQSPS